MATNAPAAADPKSASPAIPPIGADGPALPVARKGLLTIGVMLATLIQILDTTIANVALPHMQTSLGATSDTVTWVLTSYIVATAIAIPITGWLADRVGSRRLFLAAIIGFMVSSALCGMAQSLAEMVIFRVMQGVAAAFMGPLSQTVMLDINARKDQPKAMAVWGMGIMVGPILGPVLGGWLTDNFNWRWVFYVNLPLGFICVAIMWWLLPSRPVRRRQFDVLGFILLLIGIGALQLLLDRGQHADWFESAEIWIEALVAGIALWMLAVHMATGKNPMFERSMWANRNLVVGLMFMLIIGVVTMAPMALLPSMLQSLFGYSVIDTGLLLMPRGIGVLITMGFGARLMARGVDPRILVGSGFALVALSLWEMTSWSLEMGAMPFITSGLIQGLGMGLIFMPLNSMAFATLSPSLRTEGASLLNLLRSLGSSIGISIVTTVLARATQTSHADLVPHISNETLSGLDAGMLTQLGGQSETVLAMANAEVTRQAMMIAYLNDFYLMSILSICALPLIFLLRRAKVPVPNDPAAAGH